MKKKKLNKHWFKTRGQDFIKLKNEINKNNIEENKKEKKYLLLA